MLRFQIQQLNDLSKMLLGKVDEAHKPSDIEKLTNLALKCMADAREIVREMAANSIAVYCECCIRQEKFPDYGHYLDFCARNSLETLSEADFEGFLTEIGLKTGG